ncbi:MAG: DUF169 domain-containing protein [Terriglobia bacterium]
MNDYERFTRNVSEGMGLVRPPLGLAFLDEPPEGVPRIAQSAPSACAFWKAAETALFYATAEDHYNCPIGAITQGFDLPETVMQQGMELIGRMGGIQYFAAAEVEHVPRVSKPHRVVVYGPLEKFKNFSPDLALMICSAYQAMILSEVTGATAWEGKEGAHIFGRPACGVIPRALSEGSLTTSLACKGARTFAAIEDSELIVAIPASRLQEVEVRVSAILKANAEMQRYYDGRKAQFGPQ